MIDITKREAFFLRDNGFENAIHKAANKKHGHYFCEERCKAYDVLMKHRKDSILK